MMIATIIGWIASLVTATIAALGYPGLLLLMALESMIFPLPSELVMPFAGFLAAQGRFSFSLVLVYSTLGSLIGSLVSYYVGYYGGEPVVRRYGRWLLLTKNDLDKTERWFRRRGEVTIFFSRLIPVVRHLISIPAGMGKMKLKRFCLYTVLGAALWNAFLAWLGYLLGKNWELVTQYTEPISVAVLIFLIVACGIFVARHIKKK